jgi:hypothetical protein
VNPKSLAVIRQLLVLFLFFGACRPSERVIEVSVAVDFGPAGKPAVEKKINVAETSTVFEALRRAFPVATSGR